MRGRLMTGWGGHPRAVRRDYETYLPASFHSYTVPTGSTMEWKDRQVLITGVSGFVGSHLARHLTDQGARVFGLVRRRADGSIPKNIREKHIERAIGIIEGGLEDLPAISNALDIASPDVIFHLGAQSYVPRSFTHPLETAQTNGIGTNNLLEAIRIKGASPVTVFAGSSEEYGLVFSSEEQYARMKERYGVIFPEAEIPEVPIKETNPLRPMSPYAVSKVFGDYLMRNYYHTYGLKTVVSRAFNHEGAGRGIMFVTSVITKQVAALRAGETDTIRIGNVNAFRDWSHVDDIIRGYCLLSESGRFGDVYNQGSMTTTSVLSYLLMSFEAAGMPVTRIETFKHTKVVENPTEPDTSPVFGVPFEKTRLDRMLLAEEIGYSLADGGIIVHTGERQVRVEFDAERFRPAEVPILFADTTKIRRLGFRTARGISDIIRDQLNYFIDASNRES